LVVRHKGLVGNKPITMGILLFQTRGFYF